MYCHTFKRHAFFSKGALLPAAILLAGALLSQQALAHAHLKTQTPAASSTVSAAPDKLTLEFTEGVEPAFSGVELALADNTAVATGKPQIDGAANTRLIVPLAAPLAAGRYQVKWHVVSVDGHKTHGAYVFTVK